MVQLYLFLSDKMVLLSVLNVIRFVLLVFLFSDIDRTILRIPQYLSSFLSNNTFLLFYHMLLVFQNVPIKDDHASCTLFLPSRVFLLFLVIFVPFSYTTFRLYSLFH